MNCEALGVSGTAGRISRRSFLVTAAAAGTGFAGAQTAFASPKDSVVLRWNNVILEACRQGTLGPPMLARALAMVHTAMFDAWAPYDAVAHGTQYADRLRRPTAERTESNKAEAVSYAAHATAVDVFPWHRRQIDDFMRSLGYDPERRSSDSSPAGIGRRTAAALLEYCHTDGSNQPNDYADTTEYRPVNAPMIAAEAIDPAKVYDKNRWQPLVHPDRSGKLKIPSWIAPHWRRVKPFALPSSDCFRPTGPPKWGTEEFERQCQEVYDITANLTERQKVIAEYFADGPHSEQPPGHWQLFAHFVSRRDRHTLDQDVKMFFLTTNAVFDASIACWESKREFDSVRPITAIRLLHYGEKARDWRGVIDGEQWLPYQPVWFPTPPFGEYPSGHSTFSSAAAEVLKQFTGSDEFGFSTTFKAGHSLVEPGVAPVNDVVLTYPTFSKAAADSGISRRYGGIHFESGDLDGRKLGRQVGATVWKKARQLFEGESRRSDGGLLGDLLGLDLPLGL